MYPVRQLIVVASISTGQLRNSIVTIHGRTAQTCAVTARYVAYEMGSAHRRRRFYMAEPVTIRGSKGRE